MFKGYKSNIVLRDSCHRVLHQTHCNATIIFSLPGGSPGRAIVLPPAWALALPTAAASASAKSLMLKFFM